MTPSDDQIDTQPDGRRLPHDVSRDERRRRVPELDGKLVAALERTGHALRVLLWEQAKGHGLSPMQVQLVLRLAAEPPERRRVGALAGEFDVKAPTVSDAVAALRRKGLVASESVEGDRRAQQLALTEPGRRLADELAAWADTVLAQLAGVGDADKAAALALLLDVVGGLRRAGVLTVARTCTTCRFFGRDAHAGSAHPHHCRLLDTAMAAAELRVDCVEHEELVA